VLTDETFEEQVGQAAGFLHETASYFQSRGFLPSQIELAGPAQAHS